MALTPSSLILTRSILMLDYKQPFCYMLIGPIATNKSKIAKQIAAHPSMKDCVLISTDHFVSNRINTVYDTLTRNRFKRYVVSTTKRAVYERKSIIVDRGNLTRKSRKECLDHIPDDYNVVMVVMEWDESAILNRLKTDPELREKKIPLSNVLNMFEKYHAPFEHECDLIIKQPVIYDT